MTMWESHARMITFATTGFWNHFFGCLQGCFFFFAYLGKRNDTPRESIWMLYSKQFEIYPKEISPILNGWCWEGRTCHVSWDVRPRFELFKDVAPMAVENFRALCTGEKGRWRLFDAIGWEVSQGNKESNCQHPSMLVVSGTGRQEDVLFDISGPWCDFDQFGWHASDLMLETPKGCSQP